MYVFKQKSNLALLIIIAAFNFALCSIAFAQPVQNWVSRYNGPPGSAADESRAIAIDNEGNVYVTGVSNSGAVTISQDIRTIKYSPLGAELWVTAYNGPADSIDAGIDIAVDNKGNVYITGQSRGQSSGNSDFVLVKYNASTGAQTWTKRWTSTGSNDDVPAALSLDTAGNIYVTGTGRTGGTTWGNQFITIKYNPAGDQLWMKTWDGVSGNFFDQPRDITTDVDGNVYVAGYSRTSTNTAIQDFAVVKYNTNGDLQWAKIYNGPTSNTEDCNSVVVDEFSNVYVTGVSRVGTNEASNRLTTIKYNSAGDSLWVRVFTESTFGSVGKKIALDENGGVYVAGTIRIGGSTTAEQDILMLKYNTAGDVQWFASYNGAVSNFDDTYSMAVDSAGNSYVTGAVRRTGTTISGNDYITLAYSPAGVQKWAQLYNGSADGNDQSYDIAVDKNNNVYITGRSAGGATGTDYVTIMYSQPSAGVEITVIPGGLYNSSIINLNDTITAYLRAITPPYLIVDSSTSVLDSLTFKAEFDFNNAPTGTYYIVIKHRNSLETWSKTGGESYTAGASFSYDFTTANTQAYGNNLALIGSKWCLIAGDINNDGSVDASDRSLTWNVRNETGYKREDINGDGIVDALDRAILWNNRNISVQRP